VIADNRPVDRREAVMAPSLKFSQARNDLSRVVDGVLAGTPVVIDRRGQRVWVTSVDEQRELLAGCFQFHPEVRRGQPDGVYIWLPEFAIYGEAETLAEAEDDLLDEALLYVEEWLDELHAAPNHSNRRGWVWRLAMADDRETARRVVFGD
jgi:hypothetical protein